jgi:hypothetical protein
MRSRPMISTRCFIKLFHCRMEQQYFEPGNHMCREFRELASMTPQALLTRVGSTLAMSDLFNTNGGDGG